MLLIHDFYLVIRPSTASSTTLRRSRSFSSNNVDSVQRYSYYRQQWAMQRAPGEKTHQSLRWAIRDQLLQKDVPAKVKKLRACKHRFDLNSCRGEPLHE